VGQTSVEQYEQDRNPADLVKNVHYSSEEISPLQESNNFPAYPMERRSSDQLRQDSLHVPAPDDIIDSRPWSDTFNEVDDIYDRNSHDMLDCPSGMDRHNGIKEYPSP